jgi:clan AA aspartic protease
MNSWLWLYNSEGIAMGMVQAEITLKNVFDVGNAREGLIGEDEVRSVTVNAVVDTGAYTIVINEELRQKLGLAKLEERSAKLADGKRVPSWRTDAVGIYWKDRSCVLQAIAIAEADKVLLGALPLEDMDLMIHPKTQEVVGVHGDEVEYMVL